MKIQNQGFDHVEYIVQDRASFGRVFVRMGFEKRGFRRLWGTESDLYGQCYVRILVTQPDGSPEGEKQLSTRFLREQNEGICVLAIDVEDAKAAFEEAVARGAKSAMEPRVYEAPEGRVARAE